MSVTRFDNEYQSFLDAQDQFRKDPAARGTLEVKTSSVHLKEYVDPLKLQGLLDRVGELRFDGGYREYLQDVGEFDDDFLEHLEKGEPPTTKVMAKGNDMKVKVSGLLADLPMWEVPISLHVRNLYNLGVREVQNLDEQALVAEGVRRFQVKGDMLRNSGVRFVEAGTRFRYSFDWYSLLVQVIVGDMGDLLLGTNNLAISLAYGLKPVANVGARRVQEPSVRELESILDGEGRPVVVTGANAFQMAHLYGHFGDEVTFEWGRDLTGDMGPSGVFLPLESRTVPAKG